MYDVFSCPLCAFFVDRRNLGNARLQGLGSDFKLGHRLPSPPNFLRQLHPYQLPRAIGFFLDTMAPDTS